jgi:UDP-N-acetyl-D-mannosaminuronic acid dehydrogenase
MQFYGGVDNIRVDQHCYSSSSSLKSLGIPMHPVSNMEVTEITKHVENAHRYLQIGFAEDLYPYCQTNNINFPQLGDALYTKWNVTIVEPRDGIGAPCLPKYTKMILHSTSRRKSKLLRAAMEVDEDYKRFRAKLGKGIKSAIIEGDGIGNPNSK